MKTFFNYLDKILTYLCILFLVIIILFTIARVVDRYLIRLPVRGFQEITILAFTWGIFLGSALAVRRRTHFKINIWPDESSINIIPDTISKVIILVLGFIFLIQGYDMAVSSLTRFSRELGLSRAIFIAPIPIMGALIILFFIEDMADNIKNYISNRNNEVQG